GAHILVDRNCDRLLGDETDRRKRRLQAQRQLAFLLDVVLSGGRRLLGEPPAGARAVEPVYLLAPDRPPAVGDNAGCNIRTVASGRRGDERDRLGRIVLRLRRAGRTWDIRRRRTLAFPSMVHVRDG